MWSFFDFVRNDFQRGPQTIAGAKNARCCYTRDDNANKKKTFVIVMIERPRGNMPNHISYNRQLLESFFLLSVSPFDQRIKQQPYNVLNLGGRLCMVRKRKGTARYRWWLPGNVARELRTKQNKSIKSPPVPL